MNKRWGYSAGYREDYSKNVLDSNDVEVWNIFCGKSERNPARDCQGLPSNRRPSPTLLIVLSVCTINAYRDKYAVSKI